MKALRLFLVLMFMFVTVITPVQAQAGEQFGFVPLVTAAKEGVPLRLQARDAFQRLAPKLMALKQSGVILDFEPEFNAGILKIRYRAGSTPLKLGKLVVVNNIHTALAKVPRARNSAVKPEVFSPIFYPTLYSSCFDAYNLGANAYIIGNIKNKSNVVVGNYAGNADVDGELYDCFDRNGSYAYVVPGYTVTFKVYSSFGGTLLGTYSSATPNITFTGLDSINSIATGTAPTGKAYSVWWSHPNLNVADNYTTGNKTGTIAGGVWGVDFGTTKFRGGDWIYIYITQNARFIFERGMYVPHMYCEVGSNYCGIYGFPLQPASLTITHAGVAYNFTGKFSTFGWFSANLLDSTGSPILLAAGDKVSGTNLAAYTLPNLTANPNYVTDTVSGIAPANRYFRTWVEDVYNSWWYSVWVHSDSAGSYSANFSGIFDLRAVDALIFEVFFIDLATGNETYRYFQTAP